MLSSEAREELKKQHYRVVGEHSAVKICGWTKNMILGKGGCYKLKFYGIMSNQCMQMTTSISCANRCTFCWRGYKAPVSKEWKWGVDDPEIILTESLKAQDKLLEGFKGNPTANKTMYNQSREVKHVALSLTGEPITYPRMNELIKKFNREHISTFLVTNAQYPDQIRDLLPITQLYISLDAPNKELLKDIDRPLFADFWERLNQSLEYLSTKKQRTCIRLTIIKGVNDVEAQNYAKLILLGNPDFIEVKGYMHVGPSRERHTIEQMPWHEDVVEFSEELLRYLPDYSIVTEHIPSRVVMFAKKKYFVDGKWMTWIDFDKYNELALSESEFSTDEYLKATPNTGLSGRNTQKEYEYSPRRKTEKIEQGKNKNNRPETSGPNSEDVDESELE